MTFKFNPSPAAAVAFAKLGAHAGLCAESGTRNQEPAPIDNPQPKVRGLPVQCVSASRFPDPAAAAAVIVILLHEKRHPSALKRRPPLAATSDTRSSYTPRFSIQTAPLP